MFDTIYRARRRTGARSGRWRTSGATIFFGINLLFILDVFSVVRSSYFLWWLTSELLRLSLVIRIRRVGVCVHLSLFGWLATFSSGYLISNFLISIHCEPNGLFGPFVIARSRVEIDIWPRHGKSFHVPKKHFHMRRDMTRRRKIHNIVFDRFINALTMRWSG